MAGETTKTTQESLNFRRVYKDFSAKVAPLLQGKADLHGSPGEIKIAFQAFGDAAVGFVSSLSGNPSAEKEVASAIAGGDTTALSQKLQELFPEKLTYPSGEEKKTDYGTVLENLYSEFVKRYGGSLPENIPETFDKFLINSTLAQARGILTGGFSGVPKVVADEEKPKKEEVKEVKGEEKNDHEKEIKPVVMPSNKKDDSLEEWKAGWFKGKITLVDRKIKSEVIQAMSEGESAGKDEQIRKYSFLRQEIPKIKNLDELREVSIAWLSVMFGGNEVQQETYRTEIIDLLELQAKQLSELTDSKIDQEKAIFAQKLLRSSRDLYVFWWEGWMGKESGQGSSVSMASIATPAAKFDTTGAYAFLMEQKAIAISQHTEDVKQGKKLFDKVRELDDKSVVWNMMGYMMRRSTGMAIYDGLRDFTVGDYEKIRNLVEKIKPLEDISDVAHRDENEVQIKELDLQISVVISEMIGGLRPDSRDYILFLNHFAPWYLNVRYRHKFKDRLDFMVRQNKNIEDFFGGLSHQGFIDQNTVNKLIEQFRYLNIAEVGAYSEHKRPDTYNAAWDENLRIIAAVAGDARVRLPEDKFQEVIVDLEAKKDKRQVEILQRARAVFKEYEGDEKNLNEMIGTGLNFAMKMISIYEPGRDKRSIAENGRKKSSYTDWEKVFGLASTDWESDKLLSFDNAKKTDILLKFMSSPPVSPQDREEIVKNNLIRVVAINLPVIAEIRKLEREEQDRMETFFDTNIFDEFISMDDLFTKNVGERGDTWMRFFDQSRFSANAFMIYEQYAESDRKLIHEVFAEQTSPSKLLELSEHFKASDKCKHLIDTSRLLYSRETKEAFYSHATAWRLERVHKAIEAYISQLYIMSIAMYRKKGIREPVAENIVQLVGKGVNETWFQDYHFEPAKSEKEKNLDLDFTYAKIEAQRQMGNDYKLRYMLNLCGFEGNDQRDLWENGFLANINGRTPYITEKDRRFDRSNRYQIDPEFANNPNMVDYETILLLAGVEERGVFKQGEVNGYKIDQQLADIWFSYYDQTRKKGIDRTPKIDDFSPENQLILISKAKKFPRFAGKDDVFIKDSLNKQFTVLHDKFNNEVYGYFSQIFNYERNVMFVWDKVIDAYVQNTFDKDRRYAVPVNEQKKQMGSLNYWLQTKFGRYDPSKWLERKWNPAINYMRREEFKCKLLRRRKFSFEEGPGFNKFLTAQVIEKDIHGGKIVPPRVINPYDHENYDASGNCLWLHGTDVIESWLMGSGEIGFGTDWRLTRLPIGYDWFSLLCLYEAIFAEETAKEKHVYSGEPEWETGVMKSVEDRRILLGPWSKSLTPELREMLYDIIEDPGGTGVLGLRDKTKLKERNGCTPEQVEEFRQERAARDVADLEMGAEKAINLESEERLKVLDQSSKVLFELPTAVGAEIGGLLNLKEGFKNAFRSSRNFGMTFANGLMVGVPIAFGIALAGGSILINPFVYAGSVIIGALSIVGNTLSKNDLPPNKRAKLDFFQFRLPWWKSVAKNSPRFFGLPLFALPIIGGTILTSKRNLREQGRDAEVMIEGREPIYDTVVSKQIAKAFEEVLKFYKEKLDLSSANIDKRAGGH